MFAYMNPQPGWEAKITSSEYWDSSSQRGWGKSGLGRAKRAPQPSRESKHKQGLSHPLLLPFVPDLEPALRLCSPFPWSHPSLSEPSAPGMTHGVVMKLLLPGVALARPAGRVPGSPRDAVYIVSTVI